MNEDTFLNEHRKLIPGYEDYAVDTNGVVYSKNGFYSWEVLNSCPNTRGYPIVILSKDGRRVARKVAVLVLITFVGPRPKNHVARHFPDKSVTNSKLENLQWSTQKENLADRYVHGTMVQGESSGNFAVLETDVRNIRKEYAETNITQRELGIKYKVGRRTISDIVNYVTWKHVKDEET